MVATLILFLLINGHFIISYAFFFLYELELQLGGAVEISHWALVVLKPPLAVRRSVVATWFIFLGYTGRYCCILGSFTRT